MHVNNDQLQVMFDHGGASVRSLLHDGMYASVVELPAGADFTAALRGLPDDLCPCSHWGYVLEGSVHIRYRDGTEETASAGEVFFWPGGHTAWTTERAKFFEMSPESGLQQLFDHLVAKSS